MATGKKECVMIELKNNQLLFSFPEVHPRAKLEVEFQRTLRIPDDGDDYSLPPGLGKFPVFHVDDYTERVPDSWLEHGGVMLPMYQSEALWLNFDVSNIANQGNYPFAIKVATGKVDAVTGKSWCQGLHQHPQDFLVAPEQPWLDGYCVEKGIIRQFVAMPLGAGYTAEEQITGEAEVGGLQIMAFPMKREVFESRFPVRKGRPRGMIGSTLLMRSCVRASEMGIAPGGRMRQKIHEDPFNLDDWDLEQGSRCFVHIANSLVWREITGNDPPTTPPTAKEYTRAGLPWFEYYDDTATAVEGSKILNKLKSVVSKGKEKHDMPLPENESVKPKNIVHLQKHLKEGQVREGVF
jgi:hypothetical protein